MEEKYVGDSKYVLSKIPNRVGQIAYTEENVFFFIFQALFATFSGVIRGRSPKED